MCQVAVPDSQSYAKTWLSTLCAFCRTLEVFLDELPLDACTESLCEIPESGDVGIYCKLLESAERPVFSHAVMEQEGDGIREACASAKQCLMVVRANPRTNQFRPSRPTFFFQKALGVALSVAVECEKCIRMEEVA
jgi:hypothetical protein